MRKAHLTSVTFATTYHHSHHKRAGIVVTVHQIGPVRLNNFEPSNTRRQQ